MKIWIGAGFRIGAVIVMRASFKVSAFSSVMRAAVVKEEKWSVTNRMYCPALLITSA